MHPEIVRQQPGSCPICGMALEPRTATLEEEVNPELVFMTRRFWASLVLTIPVLLLGMGLIPAQLFEHWVPVLPTNLVQLILSTPVVLWSCWPFFQRGWASILNRSLNM